MLTMGAAALVLAGCEPDPVKVAKVARTPSERADLAGIQTIVDTEATTYADLTTKFNDSKTTRASVAEVHALSGMLLRSGLSKSR